MPPSHHFSQPSPVRCRQDAHRCLRKRGPQRLRCQAPAFWLVATTCLDQFHPPVLGAAKVAAVVCHRLRFAVTLAAEPRSVDAVAAQPLFHTGGAGFGEFLVVVITADVVGMTLHLDRKACRLRPSTAAARVSTTSDSGLMVALLKSKVTP